MKRILYIAITAIVLSTTMTFAQDRYDALRWSQHFYDGTARFSSMGGSFGALGGDFAALSVNPAGIGVYRSAEFTLTPSYLSTNTKSAFANQSSFSKTKDRGDFNFGYVQPFILRNDDNGLVSFNVGIGYNTMADYSYNSFAYNELDGYNSSNPNFSLLDVLADKATKRYNYYDPTYMEANNRYSEFYPSEWDVVLAWNNALIEDDLAGGFYPVLGNSDRIEQRRLIESKGKNSELVFNFGGNYANKLYFGLTIGVQDINYKKYVTHQEDVTYTDISAPTDLIWFQYQQYFETQGAGFNMKLGLIYRHDDNWRFGLAIHTPTWMNLTDYYQAGLVSEFKSDSQLYDPDITPTNEYDYKVNTPARYNLSAAYLFPNQFGAVNIDYEFVDYSTIKMNDRDKMSGGNSFASENNILKKEFTGVSNIRLGAEIKPIPNFAVRAGYAFYGNPYDSGDLGSDTQIYSFGLGYRIDGFFVDAAYKYSTAKSNYSIFQNSNSISEKYNTNQVLLTVGFRF